METVETCPIARHPGAVRGPHSHQASEHFMQLRNRQLVAVWSAVLACCMGRASWGDQPTPEGIEFFESRIRPVLVEHCYSCHSAEADEIESGLRLDTRDGWMVGGDRGPVVLPGKPDESPLIQALRYESLEMPPDKKLPPQVVADFVRWLEMGAPDPRVEAGSESAASVQPGVAWDEARRFWAFQPPQSHLPPPVDPARWSRVTSDRFIRAAREQAGLSPAPEAERPTLIRRVTFDLTGLPPTPAETAAFEADSRPDALERLADRLLTSPANGERWARLWLDVARYAEDQAHIVGDDKELFYPNAYRYRDWVIDALNRDLPYDQFVKLQLAADQYQPEDPQSHVALGFLGLGPKYYGRDMPEVMAEEWEDRVDTVGRGLLGLTVACARCHDHKYDPIPTADYYGLAGVFASTEMFNRPLDDQCEKTDKGQAKKPEDALHIVRDGEPTDLRVFVRGDMRHPGPLAPRHFLTVLSPGGTEPAGLSRGSGRLDLAEALVSPNNPLLARVIVNRVWGQLFGAGIVRTSSNFGQLGERPTHPELLDDLALRFVAADWSLQWLQRELVSSATYRQSSLGASGPAADPANKLLSRMNRRRLGVEAWRDLVLAATGDLDGRVGGPSLEPDDPQERRRTIYARISRLDLNRMLSLFDFPDPNAHSGGRSQTTTPLQKLFVMNSPFMIHAADQFAARLYANFGSNDAARIEGAYRVLYGREPTGEELALGLQYLSRAGAEETRWPEYAQVLLASSEALHLD